MNPSLEKLAVRIREFLVGRNPLFLDNPYETLQEEEAEELRRDRERVESLAEPVAMQIIANTQRQHAAFHDKIDSGVGVLVASFSAPLNAVHERACEMVRDWARANALDAQLNKGVVAASRWVAYEGYALRVYSSESDLSRPYNPS